MNGSDKPIPVAVFGNPDAADDALGPMVARRLSDLNSPHITTIDLAKNLGAMMCALNGRKMLIVMAVESVKLGRAPGKLVEQGARQIVERILSWQSHLTTPAGSFPSAEAVFH